MAESDDLDDTPIVRLARVCAALKRRGAVVQPVDPHAPAAELELRLTEETRRLRALGERP